MAKSEMEARKNAGPFMPKWFKVRSSNKALSGKQFSPDITPAINSYDDTLKDYDAILRKRDGLSKIIVELLNENAEAIVAIADETKDIADLTKKNMESLKKDAEQLKKCAGGKTFETKEVIDALADVSTKAKGFISDRDSKWTEITAIGQQNQQRFEKARDEFKSQADALDNEEKQLSATAQKCQANITRILNQYSGIAREIDHEEIIKSLQSLTKEFLK